jgi:hypothetical protein
MKNFMRSICYTIWILIVAVITGIAYGCGTVPHSLGNKPEPKDTISCSLQSNDSKTYQGSCSVTCSVNALAVNFDGLESKRSCNGPPRSVSVNLAKMVPTNNWLGDMQGVQPEDPTRFEVIQSTQGGEAIGRTPFGWFKVHRFEQSGNSVITLVLNADQQVRPTQRDIEIISRALALLPNEAQWNKNDNRQCPLGQTKLSLFCALQNATTEISGGIHYRQPALQAVREVLNTVDQSRIKTHRIMDYNNHPNTTLSEIHAILLRARTALLKDIR